MSGKQVMRELNSDRKAVCNLIRGFMKHIKLLFHLNEIVEIDENYNADNYRKKVRNNALDVITFLFSGGYKID